MILDSTLKSLQVLLGEPISTANCDVTASFGDYAGALFTPGASDTITNGTTVVTAVAAPGASIQRLVNELRVFNNDTIAHDITLELNNNGTIRVVEAGTFAPGESLVYTPAAGAVSGSSSVPEWNAGSVTAVNPDNLVISSQTLGIGTNPTIAGTVTATASIQQQVERTTTTASAGFVGEYISSSIPSGSAVALVTGTIANVGSIVLGAGDWDIGCELALTGAGATTINSVKASISTTTVALSTTPGLFSNLNLGGVSLTTFGADPTVPIIGARVTAAATYFATMQVAFAAGTLAAYGLLQARRR
jgi:hypothetical protein